MTATFRLFFAALFATISVAHAQPNPNERLANALECIDDRYVKTGILHDRVVPLAGLDDLDGRSDDRVTRARWLQAYFEMREAHLTTPAWPEVSALRKRGIAEAAHARHPIGLMNLHYNRLRPDALSDGSLVTGADRILRVERNPVREARLFAAAPLRDVTHQGGEVSFVVPRELVFTNDALPERVRIDFDDGRGWREVGWDEPVRVGYASEGERTIHVEASFGDDQVRRASFVFNVAQVSAPAPNDTIPVTASISYQGQFASASAYVYLAPNHTAITNPAIVIEGLDLDDSKNWPELYDLLNDENLLEDLRAQGFDAIVVNFTNGTDYIQRNGFVVLEVIQQIQNMVWPHTTLALIGASMGGLCSRYALAYMEYSGFPHRVRTFVSFDSPQNGANVPIGIQHWLDFFSGLSSEAANLLASLDTPASKQLLVYHHTDPPGTTGVPNALRTTMINDFALIGDYPSQPRLVAVANGSSDQDNQGFGPRQQIILYDYNSFLVDIKGNVISVTDGPNGLVFDGDIDYLIGSDQSMRVEVAGTLAFDSAPGGWRNSMQQMDETSAPFGDIIALHNNHCFIPTVSALDLNVTDLFYDIANEPNILALTPFDAVYFPTVNEKHVDISAQSKVWIESELRLGVVGADPDPTPTAKATVLFQNHPNPFNPATRIRFELAQASVVTITIHDVSGGLVRTLVERRLDAGPGEIVWDGKDDRGAGVASGVYLYRLRTANQLHTRKMVLLK